MKEKRKRNASAPSSAPSVVSEHFLSDSPPRYATSFLNGLNLVWVRDKLTFRQALELNYHISTSQKLTSNVNVTKNKLKSNQRKITKHGFPVSHNRLKLDVAFWSVKALKHTDQHKPTWTKMKVQDGLSWSF